MLETESERAKSIRSRLLDIVLDVVTEKAGGKTRFINQRDTDYLPTAYMKETGPIYEENGWKFIEITVEV
jgi:hypothetical protein